MTLYLSNVKRQILRSLRDGELDHFQIAADINAAPFLVRAELKGLKRDHLVSERHGARSVLFRLTNRGADVTYGEDQEALI